MGENAGLHAKYALPNEHCSQVQENTFEPSVLDSEAKLAWHVPHFPGFLQFVGPQPVLHSVVYLEYEEILSNVRLCYGLEQNHFGES